MLSKLSKSIALIILVSSFGCETEVDVNTANPQVNSSAASVKKSPSPVASASGQTANNTKASPTPNPSASDDIDLTTSKPGEPDENEVVGTDTEAIKTNINWKEYYPVIKGKKYVYIYTVKDKTTSAQTEINWEITAVQDKNYTIKQTFTSSGSNKLNSSEVKLSLNNDYSPPIVPIIAVAGEKVDNNRKVEIVEKTEKVKVPYKEVDAIKVVVDSGAVTNWYSKDIGMVKSVIVTPNETDTLELKEYK